MANEPMSAHDESRRLLGATSITGLYVVIGRSCFMLGQILLARWLGPHVFGLYVLAWTVIGLGNLVAPLGMPQAVIRFQIGGRRTLRERPFVIALALAATTTIVIVASADWLADRFFKAPDAAPAIVGMAPMIILFTVVMVVGASARSVGRAGPGTLVQACLPHVTALPLILVLVGTGYGLWGGVAATVIGFLVAAIAGIALLLRCPSSTTPAPPPGELLAYGTRIMVTSGFVVLNLTVDRLLLGVFTDPATVGVYQVASQLTMVAVMVRSTVGSAFEPFVARLVGDGHDARLRAAFKLTSAVIHCLLWPGLIVLMVASGPVVVLLFGEAFRAAALPLTVLVVGQILQTLGGLSYVLLAMSGEEPRALRLMAIAFAVSVVLELALIPSFGLIGAAIGAAIGNALSGLLMLGPARRRLGGGVLAGPLELGLPCAASLAIAVASRQFGLTDGLAGLIATGILAYAGFMLVRVVHRGERDEVLAILLPVLRRRIGWPGNAVVD